MDTISRLNENSKRLLDATKNVRNFVDGLVDSKSFVETDAFSSGVNYLDGTDALGEGVLTGYATIEGMPVYLFAQNSDVMKGSLSSAGAQKIEKSIKMAIRTGCPFISIIDSAGARIGEGVNVLEGYSLLLKAASEIRGVVPHIAIVKGACVGLMSAYANLADIVIFDEKEGFLGLTSPNVIYAKENLKGNTVSKFGADAMSLAGIASLSYKTSTELKTKIFDVLDVLSGAAGEPVNPNKKAEALNSDINVQNILAAVCDNGKFIELSSNYASEIKIVIARVNGQSVGILASDKSQDDGRLSEKAFIKIKKFACLLDNYRLPLITFVDSFGVKSCLKCELDGISLKAADAFMSIASSDMPKIAVINNAIGVAYSLLASKAIGFDYSVAFAGATIAPLTADTAVNFIHLDEIGKAKDPISARKKLADNYTEREGNPFISAKDGFVDNIINPEDIRPYLASILSMLGE